VGGYRSYEAFWIGGLSAPGGVVVIPPVIILPPTPVVIGGGEVLVRPYRSYTDLDEEHLEREKLKLQIIKEDDELLFIITVLMQC
jgi:hypothetical protein